MTTSGKYKFIRRGLPKLTSVHRYVMHLHDPRPNESELVVHHIDGNKSNNDPSNLVWMSQEEHMRFHHTGENHFPCAGKNNANYRHGMCVNGQSKEYKHMHNKLSYERHRDDRLARQNAYGAAHRDHKRWYDKLTYWTRELATAETEERKAVCIEKITYLKENAV